MNTYMRLDDFTVPGFGLKVSGGMEIRTADLSGETSGTASVDKGVKPKRLDVHLMIPWTQKSQLRELIQVAETKDSDGSMHIYRVANDTANLAGVRQASFTGQVRWGEVDGLAAWDVGFSLKEHASVPEKTEQRESAKSSTSQTTDGDSVTSASTSSEATSETETTTTASSAVKSFSSVLSYVNKNLR